MSRIRFAVLTASLITTTVSTPLRAADALSPVAPAATTPKPTQISSTLGNVTPEIRLNGSGLSDVLDYLAEATGANMSVDWKALDAAKVAKDTPITLRLSGVTFRKALNLVLQQAGGVGALTFYVDDGVIQVTSQEAADRELITRTYGIDDLLFEAPDYTNAPDVSLQSAGSGGGGGGRGGGGGSQNVFGGAGTSSTNTNQAASNRQSRADAIIKLITDTVRPDVWKINGGTSSISMFRGSLLITAPRSVHEMLALH